MGNANAMGLAATGARIVAASSNPDKIRTTGRELGGNHLAMELDVCVEKQAKCGRLDAVVHTARHHPHGSIHGYAGSRF